MRELAKILRSGEPNDTRLKEASTWLLKAAEQDDVEAMAILAQNYAFGIGVTPSRRTRTKMASRSSTSRRQDVSVSVGTFQKSNRGTVNPA